MILLLGDDEIPFTGRVDFTETGEFHVVANISVADMMRACDGHDNATAGTMYYSYRSTLRLSLHKTSVVDYADRDVKRPRKCAVECRAVPNTMTWQTARNSQEHEGQIR